MAHPLTVRHCYLSLPPPHAAYPQPPAPAPAPPQQHQHQPNPPDHGQLLLHSLLRRVAALETTLPHAFLSPPPLSPRRSEGDARLPPSSAAALPVLLLLLCPCCRSSSAVCVLCGCDGKLLVLGDLAGIWRAYRILLLPAAFGSLLSYACFYCKQILYLSARSSQALFKLFSLK